MIWLVLCILQVSSPEAVAEGSPVDDASMAVVEANLIVVEPSGERA